VKYKIDSNINLNLDMRVSGAERRLIGNGLKRLSGVLLVKVYQSWAASYW